MSDQHSELASLDTEARERFAVLDALQERRIENARLMVEMCEKLGQALAASDTNRELWHRLRGAEMESERLADQIRAARKEWNDARRRHRRLALTLQAEKPQLTRSEIGAEFFTPYQRPTECRTEPMETV